MIACDFVYKQVWTPLGTKLASVHLGTREAQERADRPSRLLRVVGRVG